MIEIQVLREYYQHDKVFATEHAADRFRQRKIRAKDIRNAVATGEIIEQYPEDFPFPSCLILGKTTDNRWIHVVMSDEGSSSRIITAYFPDIEKWSEDLKTGKDED